MWRALLPAALTLLPFVAIGGPLLVIYSGEYDVAATRQHTPPVYWALITSLRQSIVTHAGREAPAPPSTLMDAERVAEGLVTYDTQCAPCHGAPGLAPDDLGLGLTPPAANLVIPGRDWRERELYWTIANGLKMTGMPAWEFRLSEDEIWNVVAFLKAMPALSPAQYAERRATLVAANLTASDAVPATAAGGEP